MAIKSIKEKNLTWVNIDKIDDESLAYLKKNYQFHHLDLEDLKSEYQTPKIDVYKNYIFMVLQFPQWKARNKSVLPHEIDIFIGDDFVITVQHSKSKEMKNFFYRCMNNRSVKRDWMNSGSGFLLFKIIESLFQNSRPILNNIGRQISTIEQKVFEEYPDFNTVKELAVHRRNILNFRRIIEPQKFLMATLSHTRKSFLDEQMSLYFDDVQDYLTKLWAITDTYKDTVYGLHVTVESLINQRTNMVIGALTVISVALLPLTLLSGIYGMNIDLPFQDHTSIIWLMFGLLALLILGTIWIMRKRKLL